MCKIDRTGPNIVYFDGPKAMHIIIVIEIVTIICLLGHKIRSTDIIYII